jgi:hypothetical protein
MVDLLCRGMPFGRVLITLSQKLRQIFVPLPHYLPKTI